MERQKHDLIVSTNVAKTLHLHKMWPKVFINFAHRWRQKSVICTSVIIKFTSVQWVTCDWSLKAAFQRLFLMCYWIRNKTIGTQYPKSNINDYISGCLALPEPYQKSNKTIRPESGNPQALILYTKHCSTSTWTLFENNRRFQCVFSNQLLRLKMATHMGREPRRLPSGTTSSSTRVNLFDALFLFVPL